MIKPSLLKAIGYAVFGSALTFGTSRLLWDYGRESADQDLGPFALMLGVGALAGVSCVGFGLRALLRRGFLTIERQDQVLFVPVAGVRREVRLEDIDSIEEVVGVSREVHIKLLSGEAIVIAPDLYGGPRRLIAALEKLRS